MSAETAGRVDPPGPAGWLRRLTDSAAGIGRARLELALLELEAERDRLGRVLLRAALGLVLLALATALALAGWLLLLPAQDRAGWALGLALVLLVAAWACAWDGRRLARRRRPLLSLQGIPPPRRSEATKP